MQESFKHPPVGGVDTSGEIDKISIQNAVETPLWLAIWATEPERKVNVEMSYSDLKIICDLIEKERRKKLKSHNKEGVGLLIENRIKELKNSRAGYMVCGISCNHAVVAELERLLKEIEDKEI